MEWKPFYNNNKEGKLYVIPLGGIGEIGKNMTLIQYKDEIISIDVGLTFPGEDMLGIDLVIPDFNYVIKNSSKLKGIVLTHGHEDHIGALPYLYKEIPADIPMYGSKLTLALAKEKFERFDENVKHNFKEVKGRDKVKIGKYFEAEFIKTTHSISDTFAIAIHTPIGTIVHTGDFKIDLTPINNESTDFFKLAELGEKGVLFLMSDSTNAEREGYTMSERSVGEALQQECEKAKGRIVVAAFASHIHRLQQIIEVATNLGRKIAIDGRSMIRVVELASRLGYLKIEDNVLIDLKSVDNYKDEEIVLLCTGTQGEPMAALSRIANRTHKHINIKEGDTVIISATPIPGNEKAVYKTINRLIKNNAEVIYEKISGIHVSGHGSQDELKLMLNLVKPKFFMPVHGEYKHLKKHKDMALAVGIPEENIIISENGLKIEITKNNAKISGKVPSGITLIDGLGIGDIGNIVLRDRQHLAQDGIVIVVITISKKDGEILAGPDIITRGFVYARESGDLIRGTESLIKEELSKYKKVTEWAVLKSAVRDITRGYLYEQTKRNPIILPIIMEV
ncbi:ribonuclease J [Haliovirga abyssi]|uniref:Ribonuclease J n=1 Tax=Haliovirga abyssi TaxID=2996794 RepID=A0AAU9D8I5_9FUSO|nr:ribonuclease J [Haliovirga abyssi]BDU49896.1 ribonuclease J [Haliovirga abyssi]